MNVNISNEFHFSDVYRIINYTGSLAKVTQCSLYFDKHRKNEFISQVNPQPSTTEADSYSIVLGRLV